MANESSNAQLHGLASACVLGLSLGKACRQQLTLAASGYRAALLETFWTYYKRQLDRRKKQHGTLVTI